MAAVLIGLVLAGSQYYVGNWRGDLLFLPVALFMGLLSIAVVWFISSRSAEPRFQSATRETISRLVGTADKFLFVLPSPITRQNPSAFPDIAITLEFSELFVINRILSYSVQAF